MTPLGLYIHVPFCAVKCPYCDFYSVAYRADIARSYTAAVCRSLSAYPAGLPADTLYFGGGTPSLLPSAMLGEILAAVRERFMLRNPEITLEVNPNTATERNLAAWQSLGVNRLSIGVQSCQNEELRLLGRKHTAEQALDAVTRATGYFQNLSCDLMLGIPGQTAESLAASVRTLTQLPIQHISAYLLSVEAGTPFDCDAIRRTSADEELMTLLYRRLVASLEEHGFPQYEISNFARPGYESRHNLKYWSCVDYLGFGPAAHSCYQGKRFAVPRDLSAFCAADTQPTVVTDTSCYDVEERVMLGLRRNCGIDTADFAPADAQQLLRRAEMLIQGGFVCRNDTRLALTTEGYLVSNAVIGRLLGFTSENR